MRGGSSNPRPSNWIPRFSRRAAIFLASVLAAVSLAAAPEALASPPPAPPGHSSIAALPVPGPPGSKYQKLTWYKDEISGIAYQARREDRQANSSKGMDGPSEYRNAAVGFMDISTEYGGAPAAQVEESLKKQLAARPDYKKIEDIARDLRVVSVAQPESGDRALVETLEEKGLVNPESSKMILVLPALNTRSTKDSEPRIIDVQKMLGLTRPLTAIYTERWPCDDCARQIDSSTRVLFSVDVWEIALWQFNDYKKKYDNAAKRLLDAKEKYEKAKSWYDHDKENTQYATNLRNAKNRLRRAEKAKTETEEALAAAKKDKEDLQAKLQAAGYDTPEIKEPRTATEQIAAALQQRTEEELKKGKARSQEEIEKAAAEKAVTEMKRQQAMLSQPSTDCPESHAAGQPGSDDQIMELAAWSATSGCTGEGEGAPGALAKALGSSNLGGVDFSTLQMRYMSDGPSSGGLRYSFSGQRAGSGTRQNVDSALAVLTNSAADLRTWLALSPDKFWVNLNPTEPDRIIDPKVGQTNAGKAMLQADLQLKTTSAKLTDPRTKLGARYWKELTGSSNQACYGSRMWIVPGDVQVREDGGSLYILKAQLAVKAVPDHVATGNSSCHYDPAIDARGQRLDDTMIVPRIIKAVNTAPEYAPVRQAFMARVVAQWIRDRYDSGQHTSFDKLIDSGNIGPARLTDGWTPRQVFDTYVHQIKNGLFTYKTTVRQGGATYRETITVGGVDFTSLHPTSVSAAQMNKQYPRLAQTVKASAANLASGPDGSMWLGDTIVPPVSGHASASTSPVSVLTSGRTWILMLIVVALGVVTFGIRRGSRRRRKDR